MTSCAPVPETAALASIQGTWTRDASIPLGDGSIRPHRTRITVADTQATIHDEQEQTLTFPYDASATILTMRSDNGGAGWVIDLSSAIRHVPFTFLSPVRTGQLMRR